ncbi:zygote arrest protein 2.S-like [Amphiura filiformis]|uniref:zygote arrest protein 2.S-like n=1 Tax=Amphiura filiformis TaxID=82378 RepID=UPI003B2201A0
MTGMRLGVRAMSLGGKDDNLVRRYGWFKCSDCGRGWESAYAWVYQENEIAVYGQECKSCPGKYVKPYKVDKLRCPICGATAGGCSCKRRDKKVHRSDLCEKCMSGKYCTLVGNEK